MIETTLKQIGEAMPAINSLLAAKLPVKAKYAVSKLAGACQREMESFDKHRREVFETAGCVVKGEGPAARWVHETDPAALKAAEKEVEDLAGAKVELGALPLDLEQFGNAEIEGPGFLGLDWAMKA